jgi:hypothetical protein
MPPLGIFNPNLREHTGSATATHNGARKPQTAILENRRYRMGRVRDNV